MGFSTRNRSLLPLLALAVLPAMPGPAASVEPLDRFNLQVGGFVHRVDTRLRADGEGLTGTPIDLRRDLGVGVDGTVGFASLSWRPFDRHEFGVAYFRDGNESTRRLERDIVFEDTVYRGAATVRSTYALDAYEASYTWWGVARDTWALGPRAGLLWYRIDLGLVTVLDVDGNEVGQGRSEEVRADLPAPTLGLSWRYTPARDWRIVADAGYFTSGFGNVDAQVRFGRAGVEWHPWSRVGLMLDYTVSDIDLETEKRDFDGRLVLRNAGARMGLVFRF